MCVIRNKPLLEIIDVMSCVHKCAKILELTSEQKRFKGVKT